MSALAPAFKFMLGDEGGYAHDPHDAGGETYEGIARNSWPHWAGWQFVDAAKVQLGLDAVPERSTWALINKALAVNSDVQGLVESFYNQQFWSPLYDQISSQSIASKLFDEGVNFGVKHSVECLQSAVNATGGGPLAVDGAFGPASLAAVNALDEDTLMPAFVAALLARYEAIITNNPSDTRYRANWTARAKRMPPEWVASHQ